MRIKIVVGIARKIKWLRRLRWRRRGIKLLLVWLDLSFCHSWPDQESCSLFQWLLSSRMRGSSGWFSCWFLDLKLFACSDSRVRWCETRIRRVLSRVSPQKGWRLKKEKQAALLAFSKLLSFYSLRYSSIFYVVSRHMAFRDSPRIEENPSFLVSGIDCGAWHLWDFFLPVIPAKAGI